jgi:DNA-binding winged helix-turn-helix (wHTH) protein/TolB-like protein
MAAHQGHLITGTSFIQAARYTSGGHDVLWELSLFSLHVLGEFSLRAMSKQTNQMYEFGAFRIDAGEGLLTREGEIVPLAPKVFDMLLVLVESGGHLIAKEELMTRVWPDSFVEEANISRNIFTLRKALGDEYIETVPKRGYRLVAPVVPLTLEDGEALILEERSRSRIIVQEQEDLQEVDQPQPGSEISVASPLDATQGSTLEACAPRVKPMGGLAKKSASRGRFAVAVLALIALAVVAYYCRTKSQPASAPIRSIAVLPFKPIVADNRDESLELGMADTLITKLGNLRQILVRSTGSVRRFSDLGGDPLAAGRELKVDSVLDGNIQRSGDRIRVTVRLTRVADGASLWSDQFDEKYTDIFALQDSVSRKVASALSLRLTGEEKQLLSKHYTENPEAYKLYVQGRFYWNKFTKAGLEKSIECYNKALENDSGYALAYSGLSDAYAVLGLNFLPASQTTPRAREYAMKALELDESLAEAHTSMGGIALFSDWDWAGAAVHLRRAIEIKPNYAEPHSLYAHYLGIVGRTDDALEEMRRAHELDPLSVVINRDLGRTYIFAHRYDDAFKHLHGLVDLDPNTGVEHGLLGRVYELTGSYDKAIDEYLKANALPGSQLSKSPEAGAALRDAYARSGWKGYWEKFVEIEIGRAKDTYVLEESIAEAYIRLGQKDSALEWVQKGCEIRSMNPYYLKLDPIYDPLRSDPPFAALLQRMGLAQ